MAQGDTTPSGSGSRFNRVDTLRSPKLTAVVADMLRRSIISGQLAEGDNLPPEPELMEQLGVSRPTLREALRVLESESLIRPRRGSRAGAEVCAPSVEVSARYMGFVLQHQGVTVADVLQGRRVIEPPLAGLLARSKTKDKAIARLREALDEEEAALDDPVRFGEASIRFHEMVASLAGVDSLTLCVRQFNWVIGRLTSEVESDGGGENPRAHRSHAKFIDLLETAGADEVQEYWQRHVDQISDRLLAGWRGEKVLDLFA
jgi:DNA-binding FadR family transcriptional regulator